MSARRTLRSAPRSPPQPVATVLASDESELLRNFHRSVMIPVGERVADLLPEGMLLPERVFRTIAEKTGADDHRYVQMCRSIQHAVTRTSIFRLMADLNAASPRSIAPVMKAARQLREKLEGLDEGARRILAWHFDHEQRYRLVASEDGLFRPITIAGTIADYEILTADLARAAGEAVRSRPKKKRNVGRPRFASHHYPLMGLVRQLRVAIEIEGGGRLTYDRPTNGGTLVTVLELLRGYVVDGLIPTPLPWRALEEWTSRKMAK